MKIEINEIDRDAINAALVHSIIGEALSASVRKALGSYEIDKAIQDAVKQVVGEEARNLLESDPDLREKVKARVAEALTDEAIDNVVNKIKYSHY